MCGKRMVSYCHQSRWATCEACTLFSIRDSALLLAAARIQPPVSVEQNILITLQRLKKLYWGLREVPATIGVFLSPRSLRARARATIANWNREIVTLDDTKLRMGPHLSGQIRYAICMGDYERPERHMMRTCLDQDDTVLELGTGLGLISTICAARIGGDRVFTVEANPQLIPIIQETYRLNGVKPQLMNCIVGASDGEQSFFVMKDFWSSSTVRRSADAKELRVIQKDCNALLREIKPTFLVIDIEGGEVDLFDCLDLTGIKKISIELHERVTGFQGAEQIRNRLLAEGFRIVPEASFGREQLFLARQ